MSAENPETQEEWFAALNLNLHKEGEKIRRFMRPYRDGTAICISEEGDDWFEVTQSELPEGMDVEAFSALLGAPLKPPFSQRIESTLRNWKTLSGSPAGADQLQAAIKQARQFKD